MPLLSGFEDGVNSKPTRGRRPLPPLLWTRRAAISKAAHSTRLSPAICERSRWNPISSTRTQISATCWDGKARSRKQSRPVDGRFWSSLISPPPISIWRSPCCSEVISTKAGASMNGAGTAAHRISSFANSASRDGPARIW